LVKCRVRQYELDTNKYYMVLLGTTTKKWKKGEQSSKGHDMWCWWIKFSKSSCVWYFEVWFRAIIIPRCSNFTQLLTTLKLFSLKARNGWIDRSFIELLE